MSISPSGRFKVVAAVHLVLRKDGKYLLGKRKNTGWADGQFHLLGGHIESGELALSALSREGFEELGIKIDLNQTHLAHVRHIIAPDHSRLHLYFVVEDWRGDVKIKEPELCSELAWFDINNLPEKTTTDSRETLNNIINKIYYAEATRND